ncbi:hypothetical protein JD969_02690 [Planctomycetota bacterium]|nr:hypothetical protein JD969_02690 [Planctomycetota bacterium]
MDAKTYEFIAFTIFSCLSLAAGYIVRHKNLLPQDFSRRIHFHTVAWVWATASFLSIWRFDISPQSLWLLLIIPLLVAIPGFGAIPLCKLLKLSRSHTGVIAGAAGMGNMGFTLGAYLCYLMLEDRASALAYGIASVTIMQIFSILFLYPVARHFGTQQVGDQSLAKTILSSFDLRAMPLYAAIAGITLAILKVPAPIFLWDYKFIDVIFYIGAFGALFGIGMKLEFANTLQYLKQHILLALVKFALIPLVLLTLLHFINLTPVKTDQLFNDVLIIESLVPTALMTVMMANLFHLDTRFASCAWFWNTVIFLIGPLPAILWYYS